MTGIESTCVTLLASILCGSACYVWGNKGKATDEDVTRLHTRVDACLTTERHNEVCGLKLTPMQSDISEIKFDTSSINGEFKELRSHLGELKNDIVELRGDIKQILSRVGKDPSKGKQET